MKNYMRFLGSLKRRSPMKNLVNRVQQELNKLQTTLQKEGNDLLKRFKNLDLVDNLESKKKEIETVIEKNLDRKSTRLNSSH